MTDETRLKTRLSELRAALRSGTDAAPGGSITGPQFLKLVQLKRDDRTRFGDTWRALKLPKRTIAGLSKSQAWRLINGLVDEEAAE